MTKFSTAALLTGPKRIGPYGDDLWRVGSTSQLVEGGSNGPFWLSPVKGGSIKEETILEIGDLSASVVADSILILASIASRNDQVLGLLFDTHNIVEDDFGFHVAPYWELAPSVRDEISKLVSNEVRLGLVVLENESLIDSDVVLILNRLGFEVQLFETLRQK